MVHDRHHRPRPFVDKFGGRRTMPACTGGTGTGCPVYRPLPEVCVLNAFCPRSRLRVLAAFMRSGPDLGSPAEWEPGADAPAATPLLEIPYLVNSPRPGRARRARVPALCEACLPGTSFVPGSQ